MIRQRIAQLRISPAHTQQGLFTSFVILLTLVVGQQVQRWDTHHDALHVSQRISISKSYPSVRTLFSGENSIRLRAEQAAALPVEKVHAQTWVF